jgi:hypothetical protein
MSSGCRFRCLTDVVLVLSCWYVVAQDFEYPHGDFEDDCELCHQAEAWIPAEISSDFDHAERGFALEGSHQQTKCRACHRTLEFTTTEDDCAGCHLDPHQSELGFDCGRCHTPRSFIDRATMSRAHAATRLPLDGTHRVIDCEDCHEPVGQGRMQFVNLPTECDACHLEEYLATENPDHVVTGFSRQCESCHSTQLWESARFNHNQILAGAECVDCHLENYLAATDPDHQGSGFSQQCDDCHTTGGWRPAFFDHNQLPPGTQCVGCHLDDYLATTGPNHQAAGFTQQCDDCHSTQAWQPATFDHDPLFPIYSGKHRNKWSTCSECHLSPSNFASFSCLDCHEHDDPISLAQDHQGVSGYSYASQACYNCHPTGSH